MNIEKRKNEHIKFAKKQKNTLNDFDNIILEHQSLPEFNLDDINLKTDFLGYEIPYPFYINAMTGGSRKSYKINEKLAFYAKTFNIPLVLGSQSAALKNDELTNTYKIARKINPNGIIISNLNLNYNSQDAKKAIEMIDADGISLHINLIQELVMEEGDRIFNHWQENLEDIIKNIEKPILVKEVGFGMSASTIKKLTDLGIKYIDVSGKGGTNFSIIERKRKKGKNLIFDELGITTVKSIENARKHTNTFYASGGIRNAFDCFKAIYLGSSAVGLSKYFLSLTKLNNSKAIKEIENFIDDLKKYFLIYGFKDVESLKKRGLDSEGENWNI